MSRERAWILVAALGLLIAVVAVIVTVKVRVSHRRRPNVQGPDRAPILNRPVGPSAALVVDHACTPPAQVRLEQPTVSLLESHINRAFSVPIWLLAAIGITTFALAGLIVVREARAGLEALRWSQGASTSILRVPSRVVPSGSLFVETFNGPIADVWRIRGGAGTFPRVEGTQLLVGAATDPRQGASLISRQTFERQPGLALATVVRPTIQRGNGPFVGFSSRTGLTGTAEFGWVGDQPGAKNAWVPSAALGQGTYQEWADNYDTLLITVIQEKGFLNLIAGGSLADLPDARLAYVGRTPVAASQLNVELAPGAAMTGIKSVFVGSLQIDDANTATVLDRFGRREESGLGRPDKARADWQVRAGRWFVDRDGRAAGQGTVTTDTEQRGGWVEATIHTPSNGPFQAGVVFDAVDDQNYWRWTGGDDRIQLVQVVQGEETIIYQTGAITLKHGADHRLAVRMNGRELSLLLDDTNALLAEPLVRDSVPIGTGAGLWSEAEGVSFTSFTVWPERVRLPDDWRSLLRPAPQSTADSEVVDPFTGGIEGALSQHQQATGSGWREAVGQWRIASGAAIIDTGPGLALVTLDSVDMAAGATVRLTDDGDVGLVLRAKDRANQLEARLAWGAGSPEIVLFEYVSGEGGFINAVSLDGRVQLEQDHRLDFVAVGREVAAYLDGQLVVQGTISNRAFQALTTPGAGLSVSGAGSGQFRQFRAGAAE
jgi:hypothetical protein